MKKIFISLVVSTLCISSVQASDFNRDSYLVDGSGNVVKSGFGLCWNTSGEKVLNLECGDVIKAEVMPAANPKKVKQEEKKQTIDSHRLVVNAELLFKFDSDELSDAGKNIINRDSLDVPTNGIEVIGHTDEFGSPKYNLDLSNRRANAVKNFLVQKGIPSEKIKAIGLGESKLLCKDKKLSKDSNCSQSNRRVELITEYTIKH